MSAAARAWAEALTAGGRHPVDVAAIGPRRWPALVPNGTLDGLDPLTDALVDDVWHALAHLAFDHDLSVPTVPPSGGPPHEAGSAAVGLSRSTAACVDPAGPASGLAVASRPAGDARPGVDETRGA